MAYENGGDLPEGAADGGGDTLSEMEHEETSNGNGNSIHENQAGVKEEEAGEGGADGGDDGSVHKNRMGKLQFLLQRSQIYSRIMADKMKREKEARHQKEKRVAAAVAAAEADTKGGDGKITKGVAKGIAAGRTTRAGEASDKHDMTVQRRERGPATKSKRKNEEEQYNVSDYIDDIDAAKRGTTKTEDKEAASGIDTKVGTGQSADLVTTSFKQPDLITGATLRDYQLYGVEWLIGLYENGLNGILADEMGLGKTLQTIAFLAHLKSKHQYGPYLVVCPASVLRNWIDEVERFAPQMRALAYYSSDKKQRKRWIDEHRREPKTPQERLEFPIFVTTYEIAINDSKLLGSMRWKFIVVDEGHRLKNRNARLTRELKSYYSANRLILTGTPVHNNLAELWSLLNFILPDVFDNLEEFERWFDFSDLHSEGGSARLLSREQSQHVISTLRDILDPFILQREKKHVEKDLPPKKEYMLYAPLTVQQKDLYEEVLNNSLRARLTELMTGLSWEDVRSTDVHKGGEGWDAPLRSGSSTPFNTKEKGRKCSSLVSGNVTPSTRGSTPSKRPHDSSGPDANGDGDDDALGRRKTRRSRRSNVNYNTDDETEKQFMDRLEERGTANSSRKSSRGRFGDDDDDDEDDGRSLSVIDVKQQSKEHAVRQAQKDIANMHLQNPIMQLRKICGHPFLLYWPQDPTTGEHLANEDLIYASGKMMMLNRLLDTLWARGHKVLIFSQFTTMLDILEDWSERFKGVTPFRIDGTVSVDERASLMKEFNTDKSADACKLFLLSTRAGGLGVNLVAADTVIFYDTDWNPQSDRQAQDRAHRIGQTKPVLVFRLVSRDTAEERIVKRAFAKQQLSTLVMSGDQFSKQTTDAASAFAKGGRSRAVGANRVDEWTALLEELKRESVQFEIADKNSQMISDEHLEMLLDRSPATFERRNQGWSAGAGADAGAQTGSKGKVASAARTGDAKTASGKSAFEVTDVLEAMEKEQNDVDYDPKLAARVLGEPEDNGGNEA